MHLFLTNILLSFIPVLIVPMLLTRKGGSGSLQFSYIAICMSAGAVTALPAAALAAVFSGFITTGRNSTADLLMHAFAAAALLEATARLLAIMLLFRIREPAGEREALAVSIAAGTGFAVLENTMYSFDASLIILARSVTAVPLHIFTAAITGYYLYRFRESGRLKRYRGYAEAFIIHGLYDLLISMKSAYSLLAIPLLAIAAARMFSLSGKSTARDEN